MHCRVALLLLLLPGWLWARSPKPPVIAETVFLAELEQALERVDEFRVLREKARELGVDVYLFGGTAAAFAHYVREYLQWKAGDLRYTESRFDFRYANIFHSLQDIDLVLDGSEEKAVELEKFIRTRFDYFQGNRSTWEVRLLREDRGAKERLLDNPDFANQNTDTGSIALMLVSDANGANRVRDILAWKSPRSEFLTDVLAGRIRFLPSKTHGLTQRAKKGLNPEIFSVVRLLTKRYQFGLEVSAEDDAAMVEIVRRFSEVDLETDYAREWIQKYGRKMFAMARNVEDAWNISQALGVRKKLQQLPTPRSVPDEDSLHIWMDREPLRTRPLRAPRRGEVTAAKLGISEVAHGTSSYRTFEAITRSPFQIPNVYISRNGRRFESAGKAEGFFTLEGKVGGKNIDYSIRFKLDPRAIAGVDFWISHHDPKLGPRVLVIQNAAALRVIPTSQTLSPTDAMKLIDSDEIGVGDRGIRERLFRDTRSQLASKPEVHRELHAYVMERLRAGTLTANAALLWFSLPGATKYARTFQTFARFLIQANWEDPRLGLPLITQGLLKLCREYPNFGAPHEREKLLLFLVSRHERQLSNPTVAEEIRRMLEELGTLLSEEGSVILRRLWEKGLIGTFTPPSVVGMWMGSRAWQWDPHSLKLWRNRFRRVVRSIPASQASHYNAASQEGAHILAMLVKYPDWFRTDEAFDLLFDVMEHARGIQGHSYGGVVAQAVSALEARREMDPNFVAQIERRFFASLRSDEGSSFTFLFALRTLPEKQQRAAAEALLSRIQRDADKRPTPDIFFEAATALLNFYRTDDRWADDDNAWTLLGLLAEKKNTHHRHFSNHSRRIAKMDRRVPLGKAVGALLQKPAWIQRPQYVPVVEKLLLQRYDVECLVQPRNFSPAIFQVPELVARPEASRLLRLAIRRAEPVDVTVFASSVLTNPVWAQSPMAFDFLADLLLRAASMHLAYRGNVQTIYRKDVLPLEAWQQSPALREYFPKFKITLPRLLELPVFDVLDDFDLAQNRQRDKRKVPDACAARIAAALKAMRYR